MSVGNFVRVPEAEYNSRIAAAEARGRASASSAPTPVPTAAVTPALTIESLAVIWGQQYPDVFASARANGSSYETTQLALMKAIEVRKYGGTANSQPAAASTYAGDDANVVATAQGRELARRAVIYQSKVRGEGRKITIYQAISELELLGK